MSALNNMNIGATVHWPERRPFGVGIISGFIWDTESYGSWWGIAENGVVIEFEYRDEALIRFYVSNSNMETCWDGEVFRVNLSRCRFLEMMDKTKKVIGSNIGPFAYCVSNRRRVPVWTQYQWEEGTKPMTLQDAPVIAPNIGATPSAIMLATVADSCFRLIATEDGKFKLEATDMISKDISELVIEHEDDAYRLFCALVCCDAPDLTADLEKLAESGKFDDHLC